MLYIVVACPGLADLIEQGHCHLGDVEVTVLDEADHMADLGFLPAARRLLKGTPPEGQRMLFSATLDTAVNVLARRFLNELARHAVDSAAPPAQISHHLLTVSPADRLAVVCALAGGRNRALVFTRTKHGGRKLARQLAEAGVPAVDLHSDLPQSARTRNLASFSSGAVRVMVATDIAARDIHVDGTGLVIHADPPAEHKAYVYRAERTARAGAAGVVITLQIAAQGSSTAGDRHPRGSPARRGPVGRAQTGSAERPGRNGVTRHEPPRSGLAVTVRSRGPPRPAGPWRLA